MKRLKQNFRDLPGSKSLVFLGIVDSLGEDALMREEDEPE